MTRCPTVPPSGSVTAVTAAAAPPRRPRDAPPTRRGPKGADRRIRPVGRGGVSGGRAPPRDPCPGRSSTC
ncbi:hypothetical protein SAM9427_21200 [Streptomyces sp. ETH9427]|nr:hypothetical protein SAM9427_21200 [Streptomyces sp. ETH9427]